MCRARDEAIRYPRRERDPLQPYGRLCPAAWRMLMLDTVPDGPTREERMIHERRPCRCGYCGAERGSIYELSRHEADCIHKPKISRPAGDGGR